MVKSSLLNTCIRWITLFCTVFITLVTALPAFAGGPLSPRAQLLFYYSEINQGHYQIAYDQWLQPPQTYDEFVSGYRDTSHIDAYFGGFRPDYALDPNSGIASGTLRGQIPGVLVGTHVDGSTVLYYGCYTLIYDGTLPPTRWKIESGSFTAGNGIADKNTIQYWLNQADCFGYNRISGNQYPQLALVDYYDKVNAKLLDMAYASWTTPWQSLNEFIAGYEDTTDVVPFTGRVCGNGTSPSVNVLLFGYHTDGSLDIYAGAVTVIADSSKPKRWGITGASMEQIELSDPSSASLYPTLLNLLYRPCTSQ